MSRGNSPLFSFRLSPQEEETKKSVTKNWQKLFKDNPTLSDSLKWHLENEPEQNPGEQLYSIINSITPLDASEEGKVNFGKQQTENYKLFEQFIAENPGILDVKLFPIIKAKKHSNEQLTVLSAALGTMKILSPDFEGLALQIIRNTDVNRVVSDRSDSYTALQYMIKNRIFGLKGQDRIELFGRIINALFDKGMNCDMPAILRNFHSRNSDPTYMFTIAETMFKRGDITGFKYALDFIYLPQNKEHFESSESKDDMSDGVATPRSLAEALTPRARAFSNSRRGPGSTKEGQIDNFKKEFEQLIKSYLERETMVNEQPLNKDPLTNIFKEYSIKNKLREKVAANRDRDTRKYLSDNAEKDPEFLERMIKESNCLHQAASKGYKQTFGIILKFISAKTLSECLDESGRNPLSLALSEGKKMDFLTGYIDAIKERFQNDRELVVMLLNQKDESGKTAFDNYLDQKTIHNEVVQYLLNLGAGFSAESNPLLSCAIKGESKTLALLLRSEKCDKFVTNFLVREIFIEGENRQQVIMDSFIESIKEISSGPKSAGLKEALSDLNLRSMGLIAARILEDIDVKNVGEKLDALKRVFLDLPVRKKSSNPKEDNSEVEAFELEQKEESETSSPDAESEEEGIYIKPDQPYKEPGIIDCMLSKLQILKSNISKSANPEPGYKILRNFVALINEMSDKYKNSSYSDDKMKEVLDDVKGFLPPDKSPKNPSLGETLRAMRTSRWF
ncbi:MAG: hypothetical protein K0R25_1032 [Rickettsiaceae bacterium]|jgi:hypothetical protein|nr:hypothetical protein [Rickettsiaceae bacterium]